MDKSTRLWTGINTLAFAGVLAVNYLANALPLNGKNTGELSNQYPNLFTPAGLTFSIWGVLYVWLLVFTIRCLGSLFAPAKSSGITQAVSAIGGLFALSSVLNMAWIFAWHWEQLPISVVIMVALLASLVQLNRRLYQGTEEVKTWIKVPFGIYQGWITIALAANITAWLVASGWRGGAPGETCWAILVIAVGTALATYFWHKQRNIGHISAVIWALLGIFIKRNGAPETGSQIIAWTAIAGIGWLVVLLLIDVWKNRSKSNRLT